MGYCEENELHTNLDMCFLFVCLFPSFSSFLFLQLFLFLGFSFELFPNTLILLVKVELFIGYKKCKTVTCYPGGVYSQLLDFYKLLFFPEVLLFVLL